MAKDKQKAPQQMQVLSETGVTLQEESFLPADAPLVNLQIPQPAPILDGSSMLARVKAMTVTDATSYETVAQVRQHARARHDAIEVERVKLKAPSLEAGRRVDAFFKPALDAFLEAGKIATGLLDGYDKEQQRIAAEKQRAADEAARKERERIEREAREERERQAEAQREREREAAAKQAESDRIAREAAEAKANEERAKREAAEAAASGDRAKAKAAEATAAAERQKAIDARKAQMKAEADREATEIENRRLQQESDARAKLLEQQASEVRAEKVEVETVEVAGLSRAKVWKWKLLDIAKVKKEYLLLDEKTINRLVSTANQRAVAMIGEGSIEVFQDTNLRQQR